MLIEWIVIIALLALAVYLFVMHKNKQNRFKNIDPRQIERQMVVEHNQELIRNYRNNPAKVSKQLRKDHDLSKEDLQIWQTAIDKYFTDTDSILTNLANEQSLANIAIENDLKKYFEDIAAKLIDKPVRILDFKMIMNSVIPEMSNLIQQYIPVYKNNLISDDKSVSDRLEVAREQIANLARTIGSQYGSIVSNEAQSLSGNLSLSQALVQSEQNRVELQKAPEQATSLDDLLK